MAFGDARTAPAMTLLNGRMRRRSQVVANFSACHAASMGIRVYLAGFGRGGMAGKGVSGRVPATFDVVHRNPKDADQTPRDSCCRLSLRLRKLAVSSPKESKKDECRMSAPKQGQLWPTGSFPRRRVLHPVLPTCLARRVFCNPHADGFGRWMAHV